MTTTAKPPFRASRYTTGAIFLHWTIALLIIANLALGFIMVAGPEAGNFISRNGLVIALKEWLALPEYASHQFHKSLGITVLVLTIARIAWRIFNPPPPEPASVSAPERRVSHLVHVLFYVIMLAIPLSGWLLVSVSSIQVPTELFFQTWLPWPHLPGLENLPQTLRASLETNAVDAHKFLALGTLVLLGLHVAGALKHQLSDGAFIGRMLPSAHAARRAYGHVTTILVAAVFAAAMIASATVARQDEAAVAGTAAAGTSATRTATAPATASTSAWTVLSDESALTFTFTFEGTALVGAFAIYDAEILFSPDDLPGSSIKASIDLGSVSLNGTGITESQLKGSDGLAVSTANTALFTADTVSATEAGYAAEGTLELRGHSVPVILDFTVDIDGGRAVASGATTLQRLDFGIGEQNDPSGGTISTAVTVAAEIVATRSDGESASAR